MATISVRSMEELAGFSGTNVSTKRAANSNQTTPKKVKKEKPDEEILSALHDLNSEEDWDSESDDFSEEGDYEYDFDPTHFLLGPEDQNYNPKHEEDPKWTSTKNLQEIPFTGEHQFFPHIEPDTMTPIDYFHLLFTNEYLDKIIDATNNFAIDLLIKPDTNNRSRVARWKPIELPDFKKFLGLLFHMGIIKLSRIEDYWRRTPLFNIPIFSETMPRNRFQIILRCLQFYVKKPGVEQDPLTEILPIFDEFNDIMNTVYYPDKILNIDESVIPWREKFRPSLKIEGRKYAVKLLMLTEQTGLVLNLNIFARPLGKPGAVSQDEVIIKMLTNYLNKGHAVYMDSSFTSFSLASALLSCHTYCTGKLKRHAPGNPRSVVTAQLQKGQIAHLYSDNGVCIGKWRETKEVMAISTEYHFELSDVQTRFGPIKRPLAVKMYHNVMSDFRDQLQTYYTCEGKTLSWYKKMGIHMLQVLLLNSYYIYSKYTDSKKRLSLYDYRLEIIRYLVGAPIPPDKPSRPIKRMSNIPHAISKIENKNPHGKICKKRCRKCSKNKKRQLTTFHCVACPGQPGLCEDCFLPYHEEISIAVVLNS